MNIFSELDRVRDNYMKWMKEQRQAEALTPKEYGILLQKKRRKKKRGKKNG